MRNQTDKAESKLAELAAKVDRIGGEGAADRAIKAMCDRAVAKWTKEAALSPLLAPKAEEIAGRYASGDVPAGEKVAALHAELGRLAIKAPQPTAPAAPRTIQQAVAAVVKPAAPKMDSAFLASLIEGVFGRNTLAVLDQKPTVRDEAFCKAVAEGKAHTYAYEQARKTYKHQGKEIAETERFAKYRQFLFDHHIAVEGLDYSACGTPKPSPLTHSQQAVANKLAANFVAVVQSKPEAVFCTDTASRCAREFLAINSIVTKGGK